MEVLLIKRPDGSFVPADEEQAELAAKLPVGKLIRSELKRVRNPRFLRKFFALLQVGFESWEPPLKEYRGYEVQANFKQFRENVTIAAGHFDVSTSLAGRVRVTPKSISFGSMPEEEFEQLYDAAANVLLQNVLARYTRAQLDATVNEKVDRLLGFVG
ncbi:DUF1367 family protein [Burkholderia ubonensis]|uniref:DUF1367 family protein n=1 Tax=Burkholderia ubonensis TaxID=101571 RepID=A0ABD4DZB9_9BURK|nr:DUF1367 family protein [Burkholderia ubonensis]KVN83463.1 hypothetical protein WJ68_16255 [Burkholderia ubonensis]